MIIKIKIIFVVCFCNCNCKKKVFLSRVGFIGVTSRFCFVLFFDGKGRYFCFPLRARMHLVNLFMFFLHILGSFFFLSPTNSFAIFLRFCVCSHFFLFHWRSQLTDISFLEGVDRRLFFRWRSAISLMWIDDITWRWSDLKMSTRDERRCIFNR